MLLQNLKKFYFCKDAGHRKEMPEQKSGALIEFKRQPQVVSGG